MFSGVGFHELTPVGGVSDVSDKFAPSAPSGIVAWGWTGRQHRKQVWFSSKSKNDPPDLLRLSVSPSVIKNMLDQFRVVSHGRLPKKASILAFRRRCSQPMRCAMSANSRCRSRIRSGSSKTPR
jgi:hypothetical protein